MQNVSRGVAEFPVSLLERWRIFFFSSHTHHTHILLSLHKHPLLMHAMHDGALCVHLRSGVNDAWRDAHYPILQRLRYIRSGAWREQQHGVKDEWWVYKTRLYEGGVNVSILCVYNKSVVFLMHLISQLLCNALWLLSVMYMELSVHVHKHHTSVLFWTFHNYSVSEKKAQTATSGT